MDAAVGAEPVLCRLRVEAVGRKQLFAAQQLETEYWLATDLTLAGIQDSFAPPETMSFWDLPDFIRTIEAAGFPGHRHRLHFYALIASPILLTSMILIAASFMLRINRRTGTSAAVLGGIMCSFMLYFMTDIIHALGLSASIPIPLAAWTPAGVSLLIGLAMLFHLEDG